MTSTDPIRYTAWSRVPSNTYLTKTQLASLDLPRRPGPVRALVDGLDFRNRDTVIELYAIAESTPSPGSVRQLAAGRRTGPDLHCCTGCGARPDLPCTVYTDGSRLCRACTHIRSIRTAQNAAAQAREHATARAAALLADDRLAVLHIDFTDRGTTPSGARRPPSAAHLTALDTSGRTLADTMVRLVGPRSRDIPAEAIAPEDAAGPIREALTGRPLLLWDYRNLEPLRRALHQPGQPPAIPIGGHGTHHNLWPLVVAWRGDIDDRTSSPRPVVPPGRADRTLYLLQQMAGVATPDQDRDQ